MGAPRNMSSGGRTKHRGPTHSSVLLGWMVSGSIVDVRIDATQEQTVQLQRPCTPHRGVNSTPRSSTGRTVASDDTGRRTSGRGPDLSQRDASMGARYACDP